MSIGECVCAEREWNMLRENARTGRAGDVSAMVTHLGEVLGKGQGVGDLAR